MKRMILATLVFLLSSFAKVQAEMPALDVSSWHYS